MRTEHPIRRFVRVFPVTCLAVVVTVILQVMISFEMERDRPSSFRRGSALTSMEQSVSSLSFDPVPDGVRVRMSLSREAPDGEHLMRQARTRTGAIGGKPNPCRLPESD